MEKLQEFPPNFNAITHIVILECGHRAIATLKSFGFCPECEKHSLIIKVDTNESFEG